MARRRAERPPQQYPRTARLGELLREVLAEEIERIDDERLELVTVTAVRVDPDLARATLYWSALSVDEERFDTIVEAFEELRIRLQRAVGRQVRARRTPELSFAKDEVIESALRIESILGELHIDDAEGDIADGDDELGNGDDPGPTSLGETPDPTEP